MTNDDLQVMFEETTNSIEVHGPPPQLAQFHRAARVHKLRRAGAAIAGIAVLSTAAMLVANLNPSALNPSADEADVPAAEQPDVLPAALSCPSGRRAVFLSEPTYRSQTYPTVELLAAASIDAVAGESWTISHPSGFAAGVLLRDRYGVPYKELLLEHVGPGNKLGLSAGWVAASYAICSG